MAIDYGSKHSMFNLGYYYHHIEKNYTMMKKHYLDSFELAKEQISKYLNANTWRLYADYKDYFPYIKQLNIAKKDKKLIRKIYLKDTRITFSPTNQYKIII